MPTADNKPSKTRQKLSLNHRTRSVPHKKPFVRAVLASLLFYLGLIAVVTSAIAFLSSSPELKQGAAHLLVGLLAACCILWFVAFFMRRSAICPLCKSPPFLDNQALKHEKAYRCKPFNYGTTAILNVLVAQRWRCMHCGTPFDLLKPARKPLQHNEPVVPANSHK
jgi:hypothetical protein